ncbi:MAG: zinc ribbon domain-containing protein [Spirochaetes bacterium]|nr:zinc ribbon domain-containing protein [Spirochaetota bacterium]
MANRMARYDVRNDGAGPYAVFCCDRCSREYRTQPDVKATIGNEVGKNVLGGLLRNIPLVGGAIASGIQGQNQRYSRTMTPGQLDDAWKQVKDSFHECPTCQQIVCNSDWDAQANCCAQDSPRKGEIAEAQAQQAAGVAKGMANAFGLGGIFKGAGQAIKRAEASMARCPADGTLADPGTGFCPECGAQMVQPSVATCPSCGKPTGGAKFCPECGAKVEPAQAASTKCPSCGTETEGAKFCPNCGNKMA